MRFRTVLTLLVLAGIGPDIASAQEPLFRVASNLPALAGARVRAEKTATGRTANVVIMGLLERGLPFSGLFRYLRETKESFPGGDILYRPEYASETLPDAFWNGDALFEDLTGDGRADILLMGDSRRDSAATPAPGIVFYSEVAPSRIRSVPALPALYASRLALSGNVLAMAGRGTGGLVLDVYRVTRATTPTYARLAQLPGLEFPALALGDCDADGDPDLFASGVDATGQPVSRLYRNDAGTFTEVATLPGLYRGDASFGDFDGDRQADLAYSGYRYGPGLAEGAVLLYRMQGCVPTPVVLPAPLRNMMGEFVALEDVTNDREADLVVSGFDEPFRDRNAHLRIARGSGSSNFTILGISERASLGLGSGTLLTLPVNGPRPAFLGIGLARLDGLGVWFYSRPEIVN